VRSDRRAAPEVVLDLSRLLSRVLHPTPTGVDRVELAYARELLHLIPDRLRFAAVHPIGIYGRLPKRAVRTFLDATEARWAQRGNADDAAMLRTALYHHLALLPRPAQRDSARARIYIQASPHHLHRPALVARILRKERARFICLVHDLIPIEHPEYARPSGAAMHRKRIDTIIALASGIAANSHATLAALAPYLAAAGRTPLTRVAHLGTETTETPHDARGEEHPYFLCIGTIEPRKNHLLLLNIWRRMADERGAANIPRLILIGRRGWENEQVIDMLERCPALAGCVEEHAGLPDQAIMRLMRGARALLLPSFAEGFGMPVSEALSAGLPVLCSDLDALREAGDEIPEYLDPLDGVAWMEAILAYAQPGSPRRDAQVKRLSGWSAPSWRGHLETLLDMADELVA